MGAPVLVFLTVALPILTLASAPIVPLLRRGSPDPAESATDGLTCPRRPSVTACGSVRSPATTKANDAASRQELHVSPSGADMNSGAPDSPLQTLPVALKRLKTAGIILLRAGRYPISAPLEIAIKGASIQPREGESVVIEHGDYRGPVFTVTAEGVTLDGLTLDGKFAADARAIVGKNSAGKLTIKRCEVKNFTNHAIDLDGDDNRVENCHVHHILWWDKAKTAREDAHGIVTTNAKRLLIKGCRIHHVSGDCFQGDRGQWTAVTIDGCDFANGALEEDMAGFKKGVSPGEDGIDTKHVPGGEHARLIVRRTRFHDFRSSFIDTPAALNLKENIEVVVDGCDMADAVVALRLRGTGRGELWPAVVNCTIRNCDVGVRYEDSLRNFRFVHNTIADCRAFFLRAPNKSEWGQGWVVANNLLVDVPRFPEEVGAAINGSITRKQLNPETLYRTGNAKFPTGKPATGALPEWYGTAIESDQAGKPRSKVAPTLGALE